MVLFPFVYVALSTHRSMELVQQALSALFALLCPGRVRHNLAEVDLLVTSFLLIGSCVHMSWRLSYRHVEHDLYKELIIWYAEST